MEVQVDVLGTAKRQSGDAVEANLNVTCSISTPQDTDISELYHAIKTQRKMHLGDEVVTVSSVKSRRASSLSVTFVLAAPAPAAVGRMFEALQQQRLVHVEPAQQAFDVPVTPVQNA